MLRRPFRFPRVWLAIFLTICGGALVSAEPVWIVGNGFHSSFALRVRDVLFAPEVIPGGRADFVVIGWGASDFYRGKVNVGTTASAIFGLGRSVLHVVPVRGSLARRFPHSDVVRLELTPEQMRILVEQLDRAFTRDAAGHFLPAGPGYFPESRFFQARERFYFPNMCNVWVAAKLRRTGIRLCLPGSLTAGGIVHQAEKFGRREQVRSRPSDPF